jgi:hypothetical protein
MRLFAFAALSLTFGGSGWPQTVTVQQPDAAGIELIGSQSPEFMGYVEQVLGAGGLQGMMEWLPFAVVLRNNSSQAVIGYDVRWGINGGRAGHSVGGMSIYGADGNSLKPGAAVVALPVMVFTEAPSAERQASLQRNVRVLAGLQQSKTVEISLDSAIFASGQFVGPDVQGRFAQDQSAFTAWRSVDIQVQSEIQGGEPFANIATQLNSIANQRTAPSAGDWNARDQATEARQLLKLYQRSGAQALSETVQQPEIQVHR